MDIEKTVNRRIEKPADRCSTRPEVGDAKKQRSAGGRSLRGARVLVGAAVTAAAGGRTGVRLVGGDRDRGTDRRRVVRTLGLERVGLLADRGAEPAVDRGHQAVLHTEPAAVGTDPAEALERLLLLDGDARGRVGIVAELHTKESGHVRVRVEDDVLIQEDAGDLAKDLGAGLHTLDFAGVAGGGVDEGQDEQVVYPGNEERIHRPVGRSAQHNKSARLRQPARAGETRQKDRGATWPWPPAARSGRWGARGRCRGCGA